MRTFAITFMLAAAGCGQIDPCAGHAGVCVGLRVQGSVALDQLAVSIDKPAPKTVASPVASLHLPVVVALDLPAGTSGAVHVGVIGLDNGRQVAAGSGSVTIGGSHDGITVTLEAAAGGVLDLSTSPSGDMSGGGGSGGTGGGGGDGGAGSTDMAGCGLVTACVNADNCCPSGCNAVTDSDCPSVCGNNVVEPSEICDDGNTVNGDGCDQTCRWREKLDVISGRAGDYGHADGQGGYARWLAPMGIAYDAGNAVAYVTDQDCTIRKLTGTLGTNPTAVTVSGNTYEAGTATGTLTQARYDFTTTGDVAFLGGALYVGQTTTLRKVDITGNLVKDVVSGVNVSGVATDGTLIYFVDSTVATGGFKSFNPVNGNVTTLANYAALYAGNSSCGHPYCAAAGTSCLVPCGNYVASVNVSSGAVSAFAGKFDSGTSKYVDACTTVNSSTPSAGSALTFSSANAITADATHIYVLDIACGSVIVYNGSTGYLYSGAGKYTGAGYVEGVPVGSAVYYNPRALQYVDGSALLIADSGNGVLRNIQSSVTTVSGAAEHPEALSSQGVSNFGGSWTDVASDGSSLYSINFDGRVAKISTVTGGVTTVTPAWVEMSAVLRDVIYAGGSLYAHTHDGLIESVNVNGTGAAIYAGTTGGVTSPPTDGPRLSAIVNPGGMTSDGTNIYFIDTYKLVRTIDAGGMVHTLAGDINSADNADGTGSAAHFIAATALTTDGKYLYIADGDTYSPQVPPTPTAVRRLNLATKAVDTIAGSVSLSGHVDAVGTAARFGNINGLASDGMSLFIADANPDYPSSAHDGPTIRQLVLATGNVGTMIGANGQESFVPGVGTVARVHGPTSLVFDAASHSLYFQDNAESVFARIK